MPYKDKVIRKEPTKAELQQELLDMKGGQDADLTAARQKFHTYFLRDAEWWYDQAKYLAKHANTSQDQPKVMMVKAILDKICPDRKEQMRGAATVAATQVVIGGVRRGGLEPGKPDDTADDDSIVVTTTTSTEGDNGAGR